MADWRVVERELGLWTGVKVENVEKVDAVRRKRLLLLLRSTVSSGEEGGEGAPSWSREETRDASRSEVQVDILDGRRAAREETWSD